jgi:hypothetical protein
MPRPPSRSDWAVAGRVSCSPGRERDHAQVYTHLAQARHALRLQAQQDVHQERRQQHAQRTAEDRQQHALGQELADQPAARRAEGRAHGQLGLASSDS